MNTIKNDYSFSELLTAEVMSKEKRRRSCEKAVKLEKLFFKCLIKA